MSRITGLPRCAMHITILTSSDAEFDLIRRSLPAHACTRAGAGYDWRRNAAMSGAQCWIIDCTSAGPQLPGILQQAGQTEDSSRIPLLLLADTNAVTLASIAALAAGPLFDIEFRPLRRPALAARISVLLQRAYPLQDERQWQQFGAFRFEAPAWIVHKDGRSIALTQKEFALAALLLSNLGRPLSRAYLQETVWGMEQQDALPSRTIDTHISRVRTKLQLTPEHGMRLTTVYGYGYQLEQLDSVPAP